MQDESGLIQVMENLESHGKLKFGLIDYLLQMIERQGQCKIERSN